MKTVAFFSTYSGVGQTALVYHLAHMYADLGLNALSVDFDPQSSLTYACLDETMLNTLWSDKNSIPSTAYGTIRSILKGRNASNSQRTIEVSPGFNILAGDLLLGKSENDLIELLARCSDRTEQRNRLNDGIRLAMERAGPVSEAKLGLFDVGPSLGELNRAVLSASDEVVVSLAPDFRSLRGLQAFRPALQAWNRSWTGRLVARGPSYDTLNLKGSGVNCAGCFVIEQPARLNRPQNRQAWRQRVIAEFRHVMQEMPMRKEVSSACAPLVTVPHHGMLVTLAQEARRPIFFLKPADGMTAVDMVSVQDCYREFREIALTLSRAWRIDLD